MNKMRECPECGIVAHVSFMWPTCAHCDALAAKRERIYQDNIGDLDAPLMDTQQTLRDLHMTMRGASVPAVSSDVKFDGRKP